jgi:hypothetical protein
MASGPTQLARHETTEMAKWSANSQLNSMPVNLLLLTSTASASLCLSDQQEQPMDCVRIDGDFWDPQSACVFGLRPHN